MLAAIGHPALVDRDVQIHGIEPSSPMTTIGKELWLECGCAAEARGLPNDFVDRMMDDDCIFNLDEYRDPLARNASVESWLLAIHAFYDESQPEISPFLDSYRKRHSNRLRYELLSTHGSKRNHLESTIVRGSGERIGPKYSRVTPTWEGALTQTTKRRRRIREDLKDSGDPMSDKYMRYLENEVTWNPRTPGTPIEQDAIWVRRAGQ